MATIMPVPLGGASRVGSQMLARGSDLYSLGENRRRMGTSLRFQRLNNLQKERDRILAELEGIRQQRLVQKQIEEQERDQRTAQYIGGGLTLAGLGLGAGVGGAAAAGAAGGLSGAQGALLGAGLGGTIGSGLGQIGTGEFARGAESFGRAALAYPAAYNQYLTLEDPVRGDPDIDVDSTGLLGDRHSLNDGGYLNF